MSEHQFDPLPKKEVAWRDVYCEHIYPDDRFSRVGDNANMESNLILSPDDCVDTKGVRHPYYKKKRMSIADKLQQKKNSRQKRPVSNVPENLHLSIREIGGEQHVDDAGLIINLPKNIAPTAPVKLTVTQGASDVTDIAWDISEVFRTGSFDADQIDLVQVYLDNFFAGNNADVDKDIPSARVDPTGHDFTKQIQNPQKVSTCVLFDPPNDESNGDAEAPQSGLRIHQLTVWHVLRAMATAQRSDYTKLFNEWKLKHKPFDSREEYDARPNPYSGFTLNREVTHDGTLTPRGILVNHSTGSGKTAVSVSALQAFWFQSDRPLLYVSTAKAVSQVIGARAKISESGDADCGGVSQRSEYARLAQLFFPNTLGNDEKAYDPVLGSINGTSLDFSKAKNVGCVQTYLGNPSNLASRLKALTFTQLYEFIVKSGNGTKVSEMCTTETVIGGNNKGGIPKFGKNLMRSVANAIIIVDEAHNLLQNVSETYESDVKSLEEDIKKVKGGSKVLSEQLANMREIFACQEIYKYLLTENSKGITLIFLTATPGSKPSEIERLCRVLKRSDDEETLISYYNAENNRADFPKMLPTVVNVTELTNEQMIQIVRFDTQYDMLRESTIPPSAIALLPSYSKGPLSGGAGTSRSKAKELVVPDENAKAAEAEGHPTTSEEKPTKPVENENVLEAVDFDEKNVRWRRAQIAASENLTDDQKKLVLKVEEKHETFVPENVFSVFSPTNFSGDNFEKRAPKIAAVAKKIVEDTPVKTFVYSAYSQATEGVSMMLEHKHSWRRISDKVLMELKNFLALDVQISEDSESLQKLEESVTTGDYEVLRLSVGGMIDETTKILDDLSKSAANARQTKDALPELEHMLHLNRDIPKSLRDLKETANKCSDKLNEIEKVPKQEDNKMSRIHDLEILASEIIGARASAENMKSLLNNVENGDIAKQISDRLNANILVPSEQAAASDLNPKGGKPRKRFVVLNETNAKAVLAVFNHFLNRDGDIIMAILANGTGVEGLDLKTTRRIIAVEPMISQVKLQQLLGRARRYCSHAELPVDQQDVSFQLFYSINNTKFFDRAIELKKNWTDARKELTLKRKAFETDKNDEILKQSSAFEEEIHSKERDFESAVREADQVRQRVSNTRDRLKEAQSTGGVTHYIAIRLNGELQGLKHVTYQAALHKCDELSKEIVEKKQKYSAFQKNQTEEVKNKMAEFKPLYNRIENIERTYMEEFFTSIYSKTKFFNESIEDSIMKSVQQQQVAIDEQIVFLRGQAADKDVLEPIMEFFSR